MMPNGAVHEFANTFKEWHYFIGGFALGFVLGLTVGLAWFAAYEVVDDE